VADPKMMGAPISPPGCEDSLVGGEFALMVHEPTEPAAHCARPLALTVTPGFSLLPTQTPELAEAHQETELGGSCFCEPSLYTPVAVNCTELLDGALAELGVITIDCNCGLRLLLQLMAVRQMEKIAAGKRIFAGLIEFPQRYLYFVTTPQAMRSPELPDGSVL
jgi:hypothetical protein